MSSFHLHKKRHMRWFTSGLLALALTVLATVVLFPGASVLNRMTWLDSGICAQVASHSFYFGAERLPLCARNTGIYLGFLVTLATLYSKGRGRAQCLPRWPLLVLLFAGVTMLAVDGFNSFLLDLGIRHLYQPNNLLRLTTGLITGLAMALLVLPMLNRLFWLGYNEQRSVESWREFVQYVPALVLCFFIVTSQNALILYPIALLSTGGLLTALGSLNLIALVGMSKRDETFERYRELLPFLGLALLFAVGEMLLLAQLKLTLLRAISL